MGAGAFAGGGIASGGAAVGDLFGHFLGSEAIFQRAAVFLGRGSEAALPAAIDGVDDQAGGAAFAELVGRAQPGAAERRLGLARAAQHAAVDDAIADLPQQVFAALGQAVRLVQPDVVARHRNAFGQRLVDEDILARRAFDFHRPGFGLGLGRGGPPIGKARLDRRFHRLDRKVADHDHRGLRRHIFAPPEGAQAFGRGGVERFLGADRQAPGIACAGVLEFDLVDHVAQGKGVAIALFGQDHAAFALNRGLADGQFARGLAHQHQRRIQ